MVKKREFQFLEHTTILETRSFILYLTIVLKNPLILSKSTKVFLKVRHMVFIYPF